VRFHRACNFVCFQLPSLLYSYSLPLSLFSYSFSTYHTNTPSQRCCQLYFHPPRCPCHHHSPVPHRRAHHRRGEHIHRRNLNWNWASRRVVVAAVAVVVVVAGTDRWHSWRQPAAKYPMLLSLIHSRHSADCGANADDDADDDGHENANDDANAGGGDGTDDDDDDVTLPNCCCCCCSPLGYHC